MLILGIVFNTIPRWIHGLYLWDHRSLYYTGQATSFVLILLSQYWKTRCRLSDFMFTFTLSIALSNMLDEFYFDPLHFGWNEVIVPILITITHLVWTTSKKS